jgi:glycosyltransferase involved in cell wall biosynthesis
MDRLDRFLDAEVQNNPSGKVFVFFSGTTFTDSDGQRPTRLARELARRGVPVIFCYWRWNASDPPQVTSFPHVFCLPIDEFQRDFEGLMSDSRLAGLERTFMMEFPHPALLEVVNYANAFGWKTVFDIIDDWEEFHQCGQAFWYDRDFESYLVQNSDLVTITAEKLLWKLAADEPERCHLLPNAFEDWTPPRRKVEAAKSEGKITIGYFGHLTASWFDWPIVVDAAKKHPNWTFQIIGYGLDKKIELLPNLVQLGKIEHSLLPAYAKHWDAAMIPFKPSRLSEAVDPIKIYEYIALGLPTVVTGMPHLDTYPGAFTAETPKQFEEAIEKAAANRLSEAEVREFLDRNRWSNRIDTLLELLERRESSCVASLALADEDCFAFEDAA